ncbi:glycoside hydrolase family 6 protein [Streptomyces candidus]|uniref:Glucanase n=1 Tax=Streptomyces candidus TaxID=67283 RepID=A0A7X0LQE5_9ACTN|nr:glycoside hydrolase family 6 protein [Streptomyces candidus]MBB6436965.1 endoglucanase [Streptomyces candidus]GHH32428.1 glucanase [Streptomyces candidus]
MYGSDRGRVRAVGAVAVGAALLLSGCSSDGGGDGSGGGTGGNPPISQLPKDNDPYWVNPQAKAAKALEGADGAQQELIKKIAQQPAGEWIVPENAKEQAQGFTEAAAKADREALLVVYNIPHRDCGQFSSGGAADGNAYRAFIQQVAEGIGDRPATVILEPDAVLHLVDKCTPDKFHEERYDLLKGAIKTLKQQPATKVYLDAGNAGWGRTDEIFEPLKRSGVDQADGFSVNVSNFYSTEDSKKYGKELSAKVGNKPFVIDTSRNGNGPWKEGPADMRWCNPPGRALGEPPTTKTGDPQVHALLWVKRPGESDGDCNKGQPKAGEWFAEYALELAKNAQ